MKEGFEKILYKYIDFLYSGKNEYKKIGRSIKVVKIFLENVESISKSEYKRYVKENGDYFATNKADKESLLDFLRYMKIGFSKKRKKEEKTLEKLSGLAETTKKTIRDFLLYLDNDQDYSQNTLRTYKRGIESYYEYSLEFTQENCRRYISTLHSEGLSAATICLRITALEKFGEFLKKPVKLKRPKFSRKLETDNVPDKQDYERLLSYLMKKNNKDYYYWIKILATTGARLSEFLQMRWEDVVCGEVVLRGKGNKFRRFFFNKTLQKEIAAYVKENDKKGYIACGRNGLISTRTLPALMKDWGSACGIDKKKMHPHAFRHFFAKMFLEKNKDVVQLAELLGHGSIDTTRIYLQKSYDEQKREFNKVVTW